MKKENLPRMGPPGLTQMGNKSPRIEQERTEITEPAQAEQIPLQISEDDEFLMTNGRNDSQRNQRQGNGDQFTNDELRFTRDGENEESELENRNAHPHPGPLPQERVKTCDALSTSRVASALTGNGELGAKENGNHLSLSLSPASGGEGDAFGAVSMVDVAGALAGNRLMETGVVSGTLTTATGTVALPVGIFKSREGFWVSRVTRTMAWGMGVRVYDAVTRESITPEQARAQALDKRAYDQNYECAFADENLSLLSHELISAAEDDEAGIICDTDWSACALANMKEVKGDLYVGFDVGRKVDLSVITVLEKVCSTFYVRGMLRIQDMRLPDQELRLGEICRLPKFRSAAIDMTGLGLGLYEYARKSFGSRIRGINFASTVPVTRAIEQEGRKRESVRVTEKMAVELLRCYEDRRMRHPRDGRLRDDLRKPEKVTSPGGRVSISATRNEAGHADHFWSLALAVEASTKVPAPFAYRTIQRRRVGKYLL